MEAPTGGSNQNEKENASFERKLQCVISGSEDQRGSTFVLELHFHSVYQACGKWRKN